VEDVYTQLGLRKFPRDLARRAKKAAAQRDVTLTQYVARAVRQALASPTSGSANAALDGDIEWFDQHRSELARRYPAGTYLAIVDRRVIDRDMDLGSLAQRTRAKFGRRSILIPRIGAELERVFHVRSPRRVG
jgi:hypothetical protein